MLEMIADVAVSVPVVLGIAIGQPFGAPDCASDLIGRPPVMCADTRPGLRSPDRIWFKVPLTASTLFLHAGSVGLRDGVVDEITILTNGVSVQDAALSALTDKFGAPTAITRVPVQNRFGAVYQAIEAEWRLPGYRVTFDAVKADLDSGQINIGSDEYFVREQQNRLKPSL